MVGTVSWDIETTGFKFTDSVVTVVSVYSDNIKKVYRFVDHVEDPTDPTKKVKDPRDPSRNLMVPHTKFTERREELLRTLDEADRLISFNGVGFDVPFITGAFNVQPDRVMRWALKTLDVFEIAKRACGRTFKLNLALEMNGFTFKTGSGGEAVEQAYRSEWDELESYCLDDSKLTYQLSTRSRIALPEGFTWRRQHGERSHDPENVLFLLIGEGGAISFETGSMPP
jgi:RNase_H superfamily